MKKVLIITYYWPPAGGGGVQRWLKFAKYLPEFGWQPVIYTPENPDYPIYDETLLQEVSTSVEVVKCPIWEPYRALRKISKTDNTISAGFIRAEKKVKFSTRVISWIRGNLIIPDARRFWISPSTTFLVNYLKDHPVDAIISTGPPHSMHLIAKKVAKKTGIPWLADFRDPWVNMDNADKFQMSSFARNIHARLERSVVKSAAQVVTVGWHWSENYAKIRGKKVPVITNGFDHTDFENLNYPKESRFILGHYGTFGDDRNPQALWDAIEELRKEDPAFARDFYLELVGPTDVEVLDSVKRMPFADRLLYEAYVKHDEAIKRMKQAAVLLVIINQNSNQEGRITGKIFEYLACDNPILGVGSPTSDCARVIHEAQAGEMISFDDKKGLKAFLQKAFEERNASNKRNSDVMIYSRKHLSRLMAAELDAITSL